MKQETEKETVKIRTRKGRIITLTISKRTESHIEGIDKFGLFSIIAITDIDSMLPVTDGAR